MLTILVEYLAAARKTGPRGAGTGLGGQPLCMTGGSGRRGRSACMRARWLHRAAGGLAAWLARLAYCLGWLAGAGGLAGMGGRGRGGRRPRRRAGAGEGGRGGKAALLRFSRNDDCSGKRPRRWLYPALRRHGSGRGTAAPRSVARQSLAMSAVSASGRCHVSPLPRHHAWRGTDVWPCQGNRCGQKC